MVSINVYLTMKDSLKIIISKSGKELVVVSFHEIYGFIRESKERVFKMLS